TGSAAKTVLARAMAHLAGSGVTAGFALFVDVDFNGPNAYATFAWQSGLGLPGESYYREERYAAIREADGKPTEASLGLAGALSADEVAAAAQRVMAVETRLAQGHSDAVKSREANLINNPMTWAQLKGLAPEFPWE